MSVIRQYVADSFVGAGLRGNPAAVCLLDSWLPDITMLRIAEQNRFSETAFVIGQGPRFSLRWFTPRVEVDLCGHATLAAASILSEIDGHNPGDIVFDTRSGDLSVNYQDALYIIDLPRRALQHAEYDPERMEAAIGIKPLEVVKAGPTLIALLQDPQTVAAVEPQMETIGSIDCNGLIITASGSDVDFVSRFFGPRIGLGEDPATGSAHCGLAPFWSERLGKSKLHALQLSPRGGELFCDVSERSVAVGGRVELFSVGELRLSSSYSMWGQDSLIRARR